MQKSNYSLTLITLLIITITLSYYHNSPNRKSKLQIAPIFSNFTLLTSHCQYAGHFFSPLPISCTMCLSLPPNDNTVFRACLCSTTPWFEYRFLTSPQLQKLSPEQGVILPGCLMVIGAVHVTRGRRAQPGVGKEPFIKVSYNLGLCCCKTLLCMFCEIISARNLSAIANIL